MSHEVIGGIGIMVLFLLMFINVPIAVSFAVVGFAGYIYLSGSNGALSLLGLVPYRWGASYELMAIPFFMLMGVLANTAGIVTDLFVVAQKWLGNLRGGLAVAAVAGCAGFAAICGSSVAEVATMGTIAYPQMKKYNYDSKLAVGCIACAAGLGILIPPSTTFIIYGTLAEESIGKLFIGGVFPGLVEAALLIATVFILVKRNPSLAPMKGMSVLWRERFASLKRLWGGGILALIIIGGIYLGVFTPTETAVVAATVALLIGLARRKISKQTLGSSLMMTVHVTAMIFFIIVGAMLFNSFIAISGLPSTVSTWLVSLPFPALAVVGLMLLVYLILGCIMDSLAMIILTLPFFLPAIHSFGLSPIWFGVLLVIMIEIALVTPPMGLNAFTLKGVIPEVPLSDIFRGIVPFVAAQLICVALLLIFPQITLFLPSRMTY